MTSRISKTALKTVAAALLAGGSLFALAGTASAHDNVGFSVSIGVPVEPVYAPPPPVVYAPPPRVVYAPPAPVYYPPRVAYYEPGYRPGWVWMGNRWERRHGWREREWREREWREHHR